MQFPFETAPGAAAIPIIFATKTNWVGIARDFPEQARQFAAANDFTAKPGKCLTLPAPDGKIARWRVLVQYILAIPHFIVVGFLFLAEYIVIIVAFFAILFTRKWPRSMFDFTVGIMRWRTRANAYGYFWMTDKYPPFSLE